MPVKRKTYRKCPVCKTRFPVKNPKSKREYDRNACKQGAYRERQRTIIEDLRAIVGGAQAGGQS